MDEGARMARAEAMFPKDGFHGTNADIKGFQGNVFSSDNPTLASTYARGSADAQSYPLRLGSKLGDTVVEGGGVRLYIQFGSWANGCGPRCYGSFKVFKCTCT